MQSPKSLILPIALSSALWLFAGDKENEPAVPVLTDAQQAHIAMALYDSAVLNSAREAIAKADENLRKALQSCGSGFMVTRDASDQQLKCIAAPPEATSNIPASARSPSQPPAKK